MNPLYQLTEEYQNLYSLVGRDDVDQEMLTTALEIKSGSITEKIKNIAIIIANLNSDFEQIQNAEKKMSLRKESIKKKIDWIGDYLKWNMEKLGITEMSNPELVLKIKTNPPSVTGDMIEKTPELLPDQYRRKKITYSADKIALKEAIEKRGEVIEGVRIERKTRLVIE